MSKYEFESDFIKYIISQEPHFKSIHTEEKVMKGFLRKKEVIIKSIKKHKLINLLEDIKLNEKRTEFYYNLNVANIEKPDWEDYEKVFNLAIKYAEPYLLKKKRDELYFLTKCERLLDGSNDCTWTCEVCGLENELGILKCKCGGVKI